MALNRIYEKGEEIVLTVGSGVSSGDPVVVGSIPCVALEDADGNNQATAQTNGVFDLSVKALDTAGANSAVSEGDIIYVDDGSSALTAGDLTPDSTNGTRFGYALEAITGGSTDTINVKIGY